MYLSIDSSSDKYFECAPEQLKIGQVCYNRWLAVRLVAGVWCLSCLVLGTAYSSTLISYITAPHIQPIIGSLEDIPKVAGLSVTVNRGQDLEATILVIENC